MATTPVYSWPTPDDTDNVKDGAKAIRDLGNAVDAELAGLPLAVRQVVSAADTPIASLTSTSFVDTEVSLAITPQQADSILLIEATLPFVILRAANSPSDRRGTFQFYNATASAAIAGSDFGVGQVLVAASSVAAPAAGVLHHRARVVAGTTSARTYRLEALVAPDCQMLLPKAAIMSITELRP